MPLIRRHDGDLVRGLAPMRRIMPFLMRRRNESLVFQDTTYRADVLQDWLARYNQHHTVHATAFEVLIYACAQALLARPELNRFVSGGQIYQRRGVQISFVVKRSMTDHGGVTTLKTPMPPGESFPEFVERIAGLINEARTKDRAVDRETAWVVRVPAVFLRLLVALAMKLDAWNLYPRVMTQNDPLYASLFLANLGSAGVSDAYHHLFEYGTVSIFGTMSALRPTPFVEGDRVVVAPGLSVRFTFDERIHDGFYAARSLQIARRLMEEPDTWLGPPDGEPRFDLTHAAAMTDARS